MKIVICLLSLLLLAPAAHGVLSDASKSCIECHQDEMPGLVLEWGASRHYAADIGCYECHGAAETDADAFEHEDYFIATIVSPKDCSKCHETEFDQFQASHHADAGKILGSLDNVLGEVVEGKAAAVNGCKQCHGSIIKVLDDGTLDPETWPNSGMGRLNPDGSKGSCAACHSRHSFSARLARQPENCGKCHLGPDHPQKEIYEESKHGIAYYAHIDRMALDNPSWIVGRDYSAAPTCATCHMSETDVLPMTHDVGDRISWTLRPPISEKIDAKSIKQGKEVKPWQDRRADMQEVCSNCHTSSYVENFYWQYDSAIELYNEKFAKPATAIYKKLRGSGIITGDIAFDDEIEWTYFYLWHHEGRRARMGAAMFAPDYTQWHGFFEVAERFYMEFIPQIQELLDHAKDGVHAEAAAEIVELIETTLASEDHQWFIGKMDPEEKARRKKASDEFKKRYSQ